MPTRTISQRELRNDSGKILREVADGATFIIANGGVVVAELRPRSGPERVVSRDAILRRVPDLPDYGMTIQELRALQDEVVDDTIIDPWTGETLP